MAREINSQCSHQGKGRDRAARDKDRKPAVRGRKGNRGHGNFSHLTHPLPIFPEKAHFIPQCKAGKLQCGWGGELVMHREDSLCSVYLVKDPILYCTQMRDSFTIHTKMIRLMVRIGS